MNEADLERERAATPELLRGVLGEGHDHEPLRH
jgi:hypothetical protein